MLPRNQAKKKLNQPHFFNNSFRQFSNFNPNQMRNELTINVTKNEPRLVIYNQQKSHPGNFFPHTNPPHQHQHHQHPLPYAQSRPQTIPNFKYQNKNQSHYHSHQNSYQNSYQKNQNRYKFFNTNQTNKLKAPYNTTQYLMYDYSKRRGPLKDQQCPDEQQQFTNDWNMALNQSEQENTKFLLFNKKQDDEQMEHDGNIESNKHTHENRIGGLKKSLSDLDLASDNDYNNFYSTSV
ncbi:unnamed protein product [Brachionus calyciflorus]|uniref:Uncharacterized protein n=1 Tax=Brachionus calyciflorus TaxID=104777 RepID=A0A814AVC1_9BILA|nr:unnamed protein product [Brachionus calyciflorus]